MKTDREELVLRECCTIANLSATNPIWRGMKLNQGVHDEKSTTGCRWIVVRLASLTVCVCLCLCVQYNKMATQFWLLQTY